MTIAAWLVPFALLYALGARLHGRALYEHWNDIENDTWAAGFALGMALGWFSGGLTFIVLLGGS